MGAYPACSPCSSGAVSAAISGTRAPLVTRYSFWHTSTRKASGNSRRLWICMAMRGHSTTCPMAEDTTMSRRAPRLRSMSGPSSGDTIAKGASVKSR